jgi:hypothetical protein
METQMPLGFDYKEYIMEWKPEYFTPTDNDNPQPEEQPYDIDDTSNDNESF